jgi:hypothetical protein
MTTRYAAALVLAAAGCAAEIEQDGERDEWDDKLAERVVDYSAALRIAALRLTGELPTLAEIKAVAGAPDDAARRVAYEAAIDAYLATPRFARQMMVFWRDTLKLGDSPALDTAPAFLARLAVDNGVYTDAFTATTGTCPGFDPATGTFVAGDCDNATPEHTGLLTNPAVNAHFTSNFAFRRVRWLQEVFVCTRFPAEVAAVPADVGGEAPYTGTFPFATIAGTATGGRVDFLDASSVVCANCHANLNHTAPVFAHYDAAGVYHAELVAPTPLPGAPPAVLGDFLPPGEPMAWRHDVPIAGMPDLGRAVAADPDVAACAIARLWNWALGKPDLVDTLTTVPPATIARQVDAFTAGGYRLRDAIRGVYTSDDFVRF